MISLKNEILKVDIAEPGELYKSMRFDWTGLINQVTLENKHTFCTNETLDASLKSEKGIGMCHEFGISSPVGYDECSVGDLFLKIGTGKLYKNSKEPYDFFKKYEFIPVLFEIKQSGANEFVISSNDNDGRGFAYFLQKKYVLENNHLSIECTLRNEGVKRIVTEEYCHNFMALDNLPVDSNYVLEFEVPLNESQFEHRVNPGNCCEISEKGIRWNSVPESDFFFSKLGKMKSWKISNLKSGTWVSESVEFQPAYCNVWGKGHVISPELFFAVDLEPGEEISWKRNYEFGNLNEN